MIKRYATSRTMQGEMNVYIFKINLRSPKDSTGLLFGVEGVTFYRNPEFELVYISYEVSYLQIAGKAYLGHI
ncbi:hypothetical protein RJ639_028359 [Escallonia herrerae]|uniref:Uncharacterized protein n=1 Tax=Escallonia herrerae TaxID=1293975 RepID=A0AA88XAV6_9ASTE|nr:hypothetical protein RJ639_028359 [Escallonia herrerae]